MRSALAVFSEDEVSALHACVTGMARVCKRRTVTEGRPTGGLVPELGISPSVGTGNRFESFTINETSMSRPGTVAAYGGPGSCFFAHSTLAIIAPSGTARLFAGMPSANALAAESWTSLLLGDHRRHIR
jgi:hypothetical protein